MHFFIKTVDECSLENESQDFGYSLGSSPYPDTQKAIKDCARKLKRAHHFYYIYIMTLKISLLYLN